LKITQLGGDAQVLPARGLLVDEPFALKALTREQLYGDLQRIWETREKTILCVTR
jgi:NitT/TauT family transport system ATP-binding protein